MSYQYNIQKLAEGEFVDYCCNFYDWFCSESSLEKKALSLSKKVLFLVQEKIINPETTYVWFKNNCPMDGKLYDDMRFSLIQNCENDFLGGICPSSGHNSTKGQCELWSLHLEELKHGTEITQFNSWSEFKKELKNNQEFKALVQKAFWRE